MFLSSQLLTNMSSRLDRRDEAAPLPTVPQGPKAHLAFKTLACSHPILLKVGAGLVLRALQDLVSSVVWATLLRVGILSQAFLQMVPDPGTITHTLVVLRAVLLVLQACRSSLNGRHQSCRPTMLERLNQTDNQPPSAKVRTSLRAKVHKSLRLLSNLLLLLPPQQPQRLHPLWNPSLPQKRST